MEHGSHKKKFNNNWSNYENKNSKKKQKHVISFSYGISEFGVCDTNNLWSIDNVNSVITLIVDIVVANFFGYTILKSMCLAQVTDHSWKSTTKTEFWFEFLFSLFIVTLMDHFKHTQL